MPNNGKKLLALALVGACSFGAWKLSGALLSGEAQASKHAVNQLWIDHVPVDERDMINTLVILDHPQGRVGVAGQSSQWRIMMDGLRWELAGSTLELFFPQDRVRLKVAVETWECKGEAPAPFELCMQLTNEHGRSVMLYSREDWEIDPGNTPGSLVKLSVKLSAKLSAEQPLLDGVLGSLTERQAAQAGALELELAQRWPERAELPF